MSAAEEIAMGVPEDIARQMQELEFALLRGGIEARTAELERCTRCGRTPLIGEHVYRYGRAPLVCELCRPLEPGTPVSSQLVHGPAFGHTIRIIDQRAA
jgi:hypothetical protein